jgi:hypothetical protein
VPDPEAGRYAVHRRHVSWHGDHTAEACTGYADDWRLFDLRAHRVWYSKPAVSAHLPIESAESAVVA